MSLGITIKPLRSPAGSLFKGRKVKLVKFVGDDSMPSGGYVVTAAQLGLRLIEGGVMGPDRNGKTLWSFIPDATTASTSTNQATILPYTALAGSATASATQVSVATVDAVIYGF